MKSKFDLLYEEIAKEMNQDESLCENDNETLVTLEKFENGDKYVELAHNNDTGRSYIRYARDGEWEMIQAGPEIMGDGRDYERHAWDVFDQACDYQNESYLAENPPK